MEKRTEELERRFFELLQHDGQCDKYRDVGSFRCFGSCITDMNAEIAANYIAETLDSAFDKIRGNLTTPQRDI